MATAARRKSDAASLAYYRVRVNELEAENAKRETGNRYGELSHDLQSAIDKLINAMASIHSDEVHTAMINSLRKQIIHHSAVRL